MLFQSVLRRTEAAIENAVDLALARALAALPLLVAAGFATAALSTYVNARYGVQTGQLIMAGGFAALGLMAMLYVSAMGPATDSAEAGAASDPIEGSQSNDSAVVRAFGDAERDLIMTMLASAAPVAVPSIVKSLIRNLPLLILILIVVFILSRPGASESNTENSEERYGNNAKTMP